MNLSIRLQRDVHHEDWLALLVRLKVFVVFLRSGCCPGTSAIPTESASRGHGLSSLPHVQEASGASPRSFLAHGRAGVAQAQLNLRIVSPRQALPLSTNSHSVGFSTFDSQHRLAVLWEADPSARRCHVLHGRIHAALSVGISAKTIDLPILCEECSMHHPNRHLLHRPLHPVQTSAARAKPGHGRTCQVLADHLRHHLPHNNLASWSQPPD
mmetsp:Transcript_20394/g.33468  ORF Transcript_20394/g.33468 Transcript_20394/m.33468 type:complete len:212 (-) Transcript_20394:85-720(-)